MNFQSIFVLTLSLVPNFLCIYFYVFFNLIHSFEIQCFLHRSFFILGVDHLIEYICFRKF